jgi:hypothetical protein
MDAAHHGPGIGYRVWTHGNVPRLYLQSAVMGDDPPADIYLRAHVHDSDWQSVFIDHKRYHLFVAPAWQSPGAYVRQKGQSPSAAVTGAWLLEFQGARLLDAHEFYRKFPLRRRVTL